MRLGRGLPGPTDSSNHLPGPKSNGMAEPTPPKTPKVMISWPFSPYSFTQESRIAETP